MLDILLHLDQHLEAFLMQYGALTYVILFLIIFAETGLIIFPFLPGDSLLFAAGVLCTSESLSLFLLWCLLVTAAILGDAVNYYIGRRVGQKVEDQRKITWIKPEYLDKTQQFYDHYGKLTIIFARFVPIVRTFAPFLAGFGRMKYTTFAVYNIVGGIVWVISLSLLGYFFGNLPWVKNHFSLVILMIMILSVMPLVISYYRERTVHSS